MNFNQYSQDDRLIVAKLNSLDKKIGELESPLETMRTLKRQLKQELAVYRALKVPIQRLPTELLVSIFEETLHGSKIMNQKFEEVTSNIADLMLVSKAWYRIIMGAPKIWSKLEVEVTEETFGREWLSRKARCVDAFMKHSGKMPVDVSLDFTCLLSGEGYIRRKVEHAMDDLMLEVTSKDKAEVRFNYDCDSGMDERWEESLIDLYEGLCQQLVSSIVGEDGAYMKRWRSLQLFLPYEDEELPNMLLVFLDYPTPQLRDLYIVTCDIQIRWGQHSFRELSTLNHIVLEGPFMPSQVPKTNGAQTIVLRRIRSLDEIDRVISFSNVRYLRLQPLDPTINPVFQPFTLPHLQTLRLGGYIPDSLFHAFEINHLPEFVIDCFGEGTLGYVPYATANWFQTVDIVNIISSEHYSQPYSIPLFISNLAGLFEQLSITSRIGVEEKVRKDVLSLVEDCRAKGNLAALRFLVTIYEKESKISRNDYSITARLPVTMYR